MKGLPIEDRLKGNNLPYNPATVAHLRAVTAGLEAIRRQSPESQRDEELVRQPEPDPAAYMAAWKRLDDIKAEPREPFPAHGILLATHVYIRMLPDARSCWLTELDLATPLEFVNNDLLAEVREIALRQRDWFREFKQHPLTSRAAIHREAGALRKPEGLVDDPYDHLQQALRPDLVSKPREQCRRRPYERETLITRHIEQAGDRARQNRKRAGLPPSPSTKEWTKEARRLLNKQI